MRKCRSARFTSDFVLGLIGGFMMKQCSRLLMEKGLLPTCMERDGWQLANSNHSGLAALMSLGSHCLTRAAGSLNIWRSKSEKN